MPNDSTHPDVAVFIDFENVYVSVRDKLDANPNFEAIMDRCEDFGRVVIARAYADWYRYPRVTSALYANSIEPIYVPTYYYDRDMGRTGRAIKNSVDMNLCIDAMKTLFTHTNIAKFVLATGDRDFIPLVNSIRQQGKEVIVIGIGGAASSHLAQSADEFIFYETLVGKKPVGDLHKDQPRVKMPEKGREQPEVEAEPSPVPEPEPEPAAPPEVYDVLVQAIHLARERGYVCSFGSLKLLMKELMGGEFKENRYKDASGRPFAKFKDFVLEAERRGKVQVFTSGTVNEVFLPGEDPYKLSQFAQDLKEEPTLPVLETPPPEAHLESRAASLNGRRRRRRPRGGQRGATSIAADLAQPEDEDESELIDTPEYTALDELLIADQTVSDAAIEERADEVFDSLLERVEEALAAPTALPELEPALPEPEPEAPAAEVTAPAEESRPTEESRPFEEAEWDLLREIVGRFERPAPFNQIHNVLREARNSAGITRTNEELRTLIKQAINNRLLERSGKGNHIVYRLAQATSDESPEAGETPDQAELIEGAEPATDQPEFYTPEAAAQATLSTTEPEAVEPLVVPPTVITADESTIAESAPAPKQRSRSRSKPAAEPPAPVPEAPAQRSRPRRKPAPTPIVEPVAPVAEAAAETKFAKPRRTQQKKAAPVAEVAPIASEPVEAAPTTAKRSRRKKTDNAE
jgi:uncharacterized protein (TIGR00288 family)